MNKVNKNCFGREKTNIRKASFSKSINFDSSEDEDENENGNICDDTDEDIDLVDLFDMDGESKTDADELCCVCADFGRDNDLWYKCSNARCKKWTAVVGKISL
mgnify:CR=1 FL=1